MQNRIKLLIFTILSLLPVSGAYGQATAKSAFATVPKKVLPAYNSTTRLDMIDYYESGSDKASKNLFEGNTRILSMTDDVITFQQDDAVETTMVILPYGKSQIIMMITSYFVNPADSRITFYTTNWQELPTEKFLKKYKLEDWMGKLKSNERADVENALPFMSSLITYDSAMQTLTFKPTILDYLDEKSAAIVSPKLQKELKYKWNGKKFVR